MTGMRSGCFARIAAIWTPMGLCLSSRPRWMACSRIAACTCLNLFCALFLPVSFDMIFSFTEDPIDTVAVTNFRAPPFSLRFAMMSSQ